MFSLMNINLNITYINFTLQSVTFNFSPADWYKRILDSKCPRPVPCEISAFGLNRVFPAIQKTLQCIFILYMSTAMFAGTSENLHKHFGSNRKLLYLKVPVVQGVSPQKLYIFPFQPLITKHRTYCSLLDFAFLIKR
jgi:hypothetical protein